MSTLIRDLPLKNFLAFEKACYEQTERESFGLCGYCNDEVTRGQIGDRDFAVELSADSRLWHRDCCPCQTDQTLIRDSKTGLDLWQDLTVRYYNSADKTTGNIVAYPGAYIGSLSRCPFCFRIFDDHGTEVVI